MLRGLKEGVGVVLKGWMRVRFCACYARSAAYGWSEGCARDGGVLEGEEVGYLSFQNPC